MAREQKAVKHEPDIDFSQVASEIVSIDLDQEVEESFLSYAYYVIGERAIPDARDGLKPVQRRIIYTMFRDGNTPEKPHVKSARIVGQVMGILHPHGDSAIYEAMVRMAQPFAMMTPMVEGRGNFGDRPGAGAAASRYCVTGDTHVRLADGRSVRVADLVDSPNDSERDLAVQVLDWQGNSVTASKGFNSGVHPVKRVILQNGMSIAGSYNHPLLTLGVNSFGAPELMWKTLETIEPTDVIALYRTSAEQFEELKDAPHNKLGLLAGAWVAEGWFTEKRAGFNNTDKKYFDMVLDAFDEVIGTHRYLSKTTLKSGKTSYSIDLQHYGTMFEDLQASILGELSGIRSGEKRIPEFIWDSTPNVKRSFLASLFEGDGSIRYQIDSRHGKPNAMVTYASKSKKLVADIQEMLLEFGISSVIRHTDRRGRNESVVRISSFVEVKKFLDLIGFVAHKKQTALEVQQIMTEHGHTVALSQDYVPHVRAYVDAVLNAGQVSARSRHVLSRHNFDRVDRWQQNVESVVDEVRALPLGDDIAELMDRGYRYVPVATVTDEAPQPVYSIKVDTEDHSFLAGGFINHNTEARMSPESQLMTAELRERAVDFVANYDNSTDQPLVLPAQFPNLVVNGISGIAVGFATNMAPHNPGEVIDAARWLLTHPNADLDKLMTFIPGPDFPTGCQIIGMDGVREAYETGRGKITIRAPYRIEDLGRGKKNIVFYEIPYEVNSEKIMDEIKNGLKTNKLLGIADAKDLTDRRNGIRFVIETKTGFNTDVLLAALYKNTSLEVSFNFNNTALVEDGTPQVLGLKDQLEIFLNHRVNIVTRRSESRKQKRVERLHLVEGLLKALIDIDKVIAIVRKSENAGVAQTSLMKAFKLDDIQADYILSLQLRRLTAQDRLALENEKKQLLEEIAELDKILNDEGVLKALIGKELEAVKKILDRPRRSVLIGGSLAEHMEAAKAVVASGNVEIADTPTVVGVYADGSVRRLDAVDGKQAPLKPVRVSGRVIPLVSTITSSTRGRVVLVTDKGRGLRVDTLHVAEKNLKPDTIAPLGKDEKVIAVAPGAGEALGDAIFFATRNGTVKLTKPEYPKTQDEFDLIGIDAGDELIAARWIDKVEGGDIVFVSTDASLLRFESSRVRPQGRTGGGVAGLSLAKGQHVLAAAFVPADEKAATMVYTFTGRSQKLTPVEAHPVKGRATGGSRSHTFKKGEDALVFAAVSMSPVVVAADGKLVTLPAVSPKRDGSGIDTIETPVLAGR